jgi:hypothetical protein
VLIFSFTNCLFCPLFLSFSHSVFCSLLSVILS